MFYFTYNESKIYESFTFEISYKKQNSLFYDINFFWDAPMCVYIYIYIYIYIYNFS